MNHKNEIGIKALLKFYTKRPFAYTNGLFAGT
jgi:hypothetical protein